MVELFAFLASYLNTSFNVPIVELLIEFMQEQIRIAMRVTGLHSIKEVVRREVVWVVAEAVYRFFNETLPNNNLIKCKFTELLYLLMFISD